MMERSHHDDERYIQDLESALAAKDNDIETLKANFRVQLDVDRQNLQAKDDQLAKLTQERDQSEHGRQLYLKEMQRCLDRLAETFNLTREGLGYEPAIQEIKHQLSTLLAEAVWAMKELHDRASSKFFPSIEDPFKDRIAVFMSRPMVQAFLSRPDVQALQEKPAAQIKKRSCNRHDDCDKADAEGRTIHCSVEDCEDCFGK